MYDPRLAIYFSDFKEYDQHLHLSDGWILDTDNGIINQTDTQHYEGSVEESAWVTFNTSVGANESVIVLAYGHNLGDRSAYDIVLRFWDAYTGNYSVYLTYGRYDRWELPNGTTIPNPWVDWGEPDERNWHLFQLEIRQHEASIAVDGKVYSTLQGDNTVNVSRLLGVAVNSKGRSEWDYLAVIKYDPNINIELANVEKNASLMYNYGYEAPTDIELIKNSTLIESQAWMHSPFDMHTNMHINDYIKEIIDVDSPFGMHINDYIKEIIDVDYVFPSRYACDRAYLFRLRIYSDIGIKNSIVRVVLNESNFKYWNIFPNIIDPRYIVPYDINENPIYYFIEKINISNKYLSILMVLTIPKNGYTTVILRVCDPGSFKQDYYGFDAVLAHASNPIVGRVYTFNSSSDIQSFGDVFGSGLVSVEDGRLCISMDGEGWTGVVSHDLIPVGILDHFQVSMYNVSIIGDRGGQATLYAGLIDAEACPCGPSSSGSGGGGGYSYGKSFPLPPQPKIARAGEEAVLLAPPRAEMAAYYNNPGQAGSASGSNVNWGSCFNGCDSCRSASASASCLGNTRRIGLGEGYTDWELDFEVYTSQGGTVKGTGLNAHSEYDFNQIAIDVNKGSSTAILYLDDISVSAPLAQPSFGNGWRLILAVNDHNYAYGPLKLCVAKISYPALLIYEPSKVEVSPAGSYGGGGWTGGGGPPSSSVHLPAPHGVSSPGLSSPGAIMALLLFVALYIFYNQRMPHGLALAAAFALAAVASLILWGNKYYALAVFIAILGIVLYTKLGK